MELEKVSEGSTLTQITNYQEQFEEGEKGELRLFLRVSAPEWAISSLQDELGNRGVELWDEVRQAARTVYIRFTKRSPVLAWVVAALIAIGLAILIIVGWQLFRVGTMLGVPKWALWIGIGVGALALVKALVSRR